MIDVYLKTFNKDEMDLILLESGLFLEDSGNFYPVDPSQVLIDTIGFVGDTTDFFVNLRFTQLDKAPELFLGYQMFPETPWRIWA